MKTDDGKKLPPRGGMLPRLSRFAVEHLLVLPLGALIALVWVNTSAERYFRVTHAMTFLVNDVAMVLFFGMITKEVVEATAPGGVLHPWRRALLPAIASIGATAVPALIYMNFVDRVDEPMLASAWPVTFAVDLAFSYLVARLIFDRHPAIPFLLLLGIAANALGYVMLALLHPTRALHPGGGVMLMAVALGLAAALRRARVKSFWPYVVGSGVLSWCALFWGGLHPALALLPIMPFLPHAALGPCRGSPECREGFDALPEHWRRAPLP